MKKLFPNNLLLVDQQKELLIQDYQTAYLQKFKKQNKKNALLRYALFLNDDNLERWVNASISTAFNLGIEKGKHHKLDDHIKKLMKFWVDDMIEELYKYSIKSQKKNLTHANKQLDEIFKFMLNSLTEDPFQTKRVYVLINADFSAIKILSLDLAESAQLSIKSSIGIERFVIDGLKEKIELNPNKVFYTVNVDDASRELLADTMCRLLLALNDYEAYYPTDMLSSTTNMIFDLGVKVLYGIDIL